MHGQVRPLCCPKATVLPLTDDGKTRFLVRPTTLHDAERNIPATVQIGEEVAFNIARLSEVEHCSTVAN